jgi:hypothetical protein
MNWTASLAAAAPTATQAAAPAGWNWGVFLGAIAGGLIGAGIPAVMTMAAGDVSGHDAAQSGSWPTLRSLRMPGNSCSTSIRSAVG